MIWQALPIPGSVSWKLYKLLKKSRNKAGKFLTDVEAKGKEHGKELQQCINTWMIVVAKD